MQNLAAGRLSVPQAGQIAAIEFLILEESRAVLSWTAFWCAEVWHGMGWDPACISHECKPKFK
jgi:hypothetical protein